VGCARDEKCIQCLVRNSEGKRPLVTPRYRWEDNIEMDLKEIVWRLRTGFSWLKTGTSDRTL
jgi:hypothetical protein